MVYLNNNFKKYPVVACKATKHCKPLAKNSQILRKLILCFHFEEFMSLEID